LYSTDLLPPTDHSANSPSPAAKVTPAIESIA
jgi:hypothetical protein